MANEFKIKGQVGYCLRCVGIYELETLQYMTADGLRRINGMGERRINKVRRLLSEKNMYLLGERDGVPKKPTDRERLRKVSNELQSILVGMGERDDQSSINSNH